MVCCGTTVVHTQLVHTQLDRGVELEDPTPHPPAGYGVVMRGRVSEDVWLCS